MYQDILYGYMLHQCLYTVIKLGVPDHLQNGEKSIDELAALTQSQSDPLYRIMRCLCEYGIFKETNHKVFSQSEQSGGLLSNSENSSKDYFLLCSEILYDASTCLLESVKTGKIAFDSYYGVGFWDYLQANPDKSMLFNNAMQKGSADKFNEICDAYDFSSFKNLIDVGGGNGQLVVKILKRNPLAKGIVFDLERLRESAIKYISNNQLSDRCAFQSGNFFEKIPEGGDVYLLSVILHDWNDNDALLILKKCREAMSLGAKLIVVERIIRDDENKLNTYLGDINMLITIGGKERTEDEFKKLFKQTGFKFNKLVRSKSPFSVIEGESV